MPLKKNRFPVFRLFIAIVLVQEYLLSIILFETAYEMQLYQVQSNDYKVLRYIILFAIYLLFSKDWKSLSQMLLINKLYCNYKAYSFCFTRVVIIMLNEFVIFRIAFCANIGEDRGLGLIVNFGAALIICELDDIIMATGRIQYWREFFDN